MSPRSYRSYSSSGFTLIEIMVVIIVLAIVSGAVIPNLSGALEHTRLEGAAAQLADALDQCRQSAASTGRAQGLILGRDGAHYWRVVEAGPEPAPDGRDLGLGALLARNEEPEASSLEPIRDSSGEAALPEGVRLAGVDFLDETLSSAGGQAPRVLFFPDGTAQFVTLRLMSRRGEHRAIEVNGLDGAVTITEEQMKKEI